MKKFTFIAEYKGGTYISQYEALNLEEALLLWADNLDLQYFTEKVKTRIRHVVRDKEFPPIALDSIENVWCFSCTINRSLLLLTIVRTF